MKEKRKKNKKQNKTKQADRKEEQGREAIVKGFSYAFKLGFLQLICNSSLIFKAN